MIDLNGLRGDRDGVDLGSRPTCGLLRLRTLSDGYPIDEPLHDHHLDIDATREVGHEFRNRVANRVGSQRSGDTGGAGSETISAAGYVEVARGAGANGACDGGVVEHGRSVIALADHHRVDDVEEAPAKGHIRHAMVVRILVDEGRNQEGAKELAGHVLGKGHACILGETPDSGPVCSVGVFCDGDRRNSRDGQEIEWIAHVFRRENEFLPGCEWQRR
jgi:hypothetical protein